MELTDTKIRTCSGCDRPDPDGNGVCQFCGGWVTETLPSTRRKSGRDVPIAVSLPMASIQPSSQGCCARCCAYSDAELAAIRKPVRYGPLTIYASGEITGLDATLTPRQTTLFRLLMLAKGHVVSYGALQSVVGLPCSESTTRMNVERMRRRLQGSIASIETEFGFGYRLVLEDGVSD